MRTIVGISGTAKNTGKTTTLLEVTKFFHQKSHDIFLTSIGYDGEDFDNITGLPKPRVLVPQGAMVASALPLLESSPANFADLKDTGVRCALGRIFTGRAQSGGKVVLAGPTNTRDLLSVINYAPENATVLLDGAFSRLSPMVVADYLILATGAARSKDSHRIAREVNAVFKVMSLPVAHKGTCRNGETSCDTPETALEEELIDVQGGLFLAGQGQELGWRLNGNKNISVIRVHGIINPKVLQEALDELDLRQEIGAAARSLTFIFDHPIMLLLSGDALLWEHLLSALSNIGCQVMVRNSTELLGVTVNPYLPSQSGTGKYVATYVPPHNFIEDIRGLSLAPCTDIILEGPGKLYSWLERLI
ncbi:MAG: hypothetical protein ACOYEQ_00720 [Bacillota bacterium]